MSNKTALIAEPGKQELFIKREFDAPKELVFTTFTDPALYIQWFMPKELNLQVNRMDCRTGGSFHLSYPGPEGTGFGFKGVYHEVMPNEYITKTSEFEGLPFKLDPLLEKTSFEELPGRRCRVTIHSICPSVEYRDGMVSAGMEPILDQTHSQLDALLSSITVNN